MSLENWLAEGKLTAHRTGKEEIASLLAVVDRDLADARATGISSDRRFATAYGAALTVAIAALAAGGYRAASEGHHYWAIQSLTYTLDLDAVTVEQFNKFRKKRNISDYERVGVVSRQEMEEMINLAQVLRDKLKAQLKATHPELL
jgi:hypothetical protein